MPDLRQRICDFGWLLGSLVWSGGKTEAEPVEVIPQAGELWQFRPKDTPWPEKNYPPVTIRDVRDGWVRYDMGSLFTDQRMKLPQFLGLYRKLPADD